MRAVATTVDPLDNTRGVPYERLAELRADCPVSQTQNGAWYLARRADVLAATKDVEAFQASFREPGVVVPPEEQLISEIPEPRHGKIRRIINSAIAQHRIGRVEPFVRTLCGDLLDPLCERGEGDLLAEYVTSIPATVIAHLLGADPADHHHFAEWSDRVVQSTYATKNRRVDGDDNEGLAGLFAQVRADPALVSTLVEESLRHDSPIHVLMRDCPHGATVEGTAIPAGDKVAFGLASANRDAAVYDEPDAFRLDRPSARDHLAFGGGPHVCPGASLARLEGRIALEVFLDRVQQANLVDGYEREPVPVFW